MEAGAGWIGQGNYVQYTSFDTEGGFRPVCVGQIL